MGGNSSIDNGISLAQGSKDNSTRTGINSKSSLRTNRSEITQRRPDHVKSKASEIQTFRILLCLSLLLLAAVMGVCVFIFFQVPETNLALNQFESIAGRATAYAQQTTQLKRLGVMTMATMIGVAHPDAALWPFVLVDGYEKTSNRLVDTISGDGMGFAPIVSPGELEAFENFAYESYYETLGYPNTTGVSGFGRGVWAKDGKGEFGVEHPDQKYHEAVIHPGGATTYGSKFPIYAPVLQHSDGATAKPLMLNLHNERMRGQTIDSILACSQAATNATTECGQMTDLLLLTQRKKPASLVMQPIFPGGGSASDSVEATGIVSSPLVWQDVLDNAFGTEVSGIHIVLSSNTNVTYTYYVTKGVVELVGEGDAHEIEFDDNEIYSMLTDEESNLYSESSFRFTIKLYPTKVFMATYKTNNPMWATIISVFIMFFLTLVFCLYDWYVRGEFTFKNELLDAKRSFIRFVSHEVRTPLNAVCMGLMLMREELEKAMKEIKKGQKDAKDNSDTPVSHDGLSEWKGVTDEILENSQNAVDVLNDLLNYDKITTGSLKLELSILQTDILMGHAQKEFKLSASKKNIDVIFDDNAKSPYRKNTICIVGDDVRLIQVLRNLMSNALKFTPPKGKVRVTLSWVNHLLDSQSLRKGKRQKPLTADAEQKFTLKKGEKVSLNPCGFLQLSVADTGAGMSEDQMANVFEQGTQFNVNELQAGQGSGLGLYIAKGIMDQHLGSLSVSSEGLGKGTVFTMSVPVYRDTKQNSTIRDLESGDFHFKAAKAKSKIQLEDLASLRILVVDDSDTNRKFLTRILTNHGHICDQARNGSIAVEMVQKGMNDEMASGDMDHSLAYDAVLLDYEMPVMNGPTAAKTMRDLGSDTFIVGITGNLLPEDIEHFRNQGANEVLPKPFNISDLEEILMEYGVGLNK